MSAAHAPQIAQPNARNRGINAVADLHDAPPCEEVGIFPQSLWRHSYIELGPEQFEAARAAIEACARVHKLL